jgi:hypothetical protein
MGIPGVVLLLASALVASVAYPGIFRAGLSACIGLVPRQNSSGGKARWAPSARRVCAKCSSPGDRGDPICGAVAAAVAGAALGPTQSEGRGGGRGEQDLQNRLGDDGPRASATASRSRPTGTPRFDPALRVRETDGDPIRAVKALWPADLKRRIDRPRT